MTNTPILYSHKELYQPAKSVEQKTVQQPPANPYLFALYSVGEAML